jgi:hypothetical protein
VFSPYSSNYNTNWHQSTAIQAESRQCFVNGLPDVNHGCRPLNPMFVNYFWQQRIIGVHDALGHHAG